LAEHLAQIGIAAGCGGTLCDMIEADRNGEFRPQTERLAGLALGQIDASAKIFSRHVEEGISRLKDVDIGQLCAAFGEERKNIRREVGIAGTHTRGAFRFTGLEQFRFFLSCRIALSVRSDAFSWSSNDAIRP